MIQGWLESRRPLRCVFGFHRWHRGKPKRDELLQRTAYQTRSWQDCPAGASYCVRRLPASQ
jgi:hypothetical protein